MTAAGDPVLSTIGQQIPIPPGEVAVGADGAVSVDGGVVATVGVFTFPRGTQLTPEGANHYVAPAGVAPLLQRNAVIHEESIEGSNQGVIPGTMNLILVQREAEMMQKALTIFHSDFNKIATEDLPKV